MSPTAASMVLTGASGLLGTTFRDRLGIPGSRCLTRADLNVSHHAHLRQRLADLLPSAVINCAADTDVESGEADPERVFSANAILPGLLAQFCRELGIPLIHFSSTGCYGQGKTTPYHEFDPVEPTTVHHRAKAAGEAEVRAVGGPHLILRLGWLYGGGTGHRKNFVWNRICEARDKTEIMSDPHQTGVPTWAGDVVEQTIRLLDADLCGTFNCVATGSTSRFGYVQAILSAASLDTRLRPHRFTRIAPVSSNESAINLKLSLLGMNQMPDWQAALYRYVAGLLQHPSA